MATDDSSYPPNDQFTPNPMTLTFDNNANDLQVFIVQNWEQNLQDKLFSVMKEESEKPQLDCLFVDSEGTPPMWKYDFGEEKKIKKIELYNFQNGKKSSLLQGAKIYVGETLCAQISDQPPANEVLSITCQDPT